MSGRDQLTGHWPSTLTRGTFNRELDRCVDDTRIKVHLNFENLTQVSIEI